MRQHSIMPATTPTSTPKYSPGKYKLSQVVCVVVGYRHRLPQNRCQSPLGMRANKSADSFATSPSIALRSRREPPQSCSRTRLSPEPAPSACTLWGIPVKHAWGFEKTPKCPTERSAYAHLPIMTDRNWRSDWQKYQFRKNGPCETNVMDVCTARIERRTGWR